MNYDVFSLAAIFLLLATAFTMLVSYNWRWSIAALSLQYIGMFVLVALSWPTDLAVVKLVTGWMAGSILGLTLVSATADVERRGWPTEGAFRILAGVLVLSIVGVVVPIMLDWVPALHLHQAWGGGLLIGIGLLNLGFSNQPLRVILSLLIILAGFEILYAVVEASTLVAGLLALVNLGVALVGAYLIAAPEMREDQA